jgi:hypothetical protein
MFGMTYLTFSNPARPVAGKVTIGSVLNGYTERENNVASYEGMSIRLNQVMSYLAEMAR